MYNAWPVVIGAFVGAVVGPLTTWLFEIGTRRKHRLEVTAALRFELASNALWLDSVLESLNYLRDEAWVTMKNNGFISELKAPLPMMVARVYARMHALNGLIGEIRACQASSERQELMTRARVAVQELWAKTDELVRLFDKEYPRIARNFHE